MFPFGFSLQELFFFTVVLAVAGGVSQLPESIQRERRFEHRQASIKPTDGCSGYKTQFIQYSRNGGVFVGRAVGFIRQKRDQVFTSSAQRAELDAMQQQLADAMSQMQSIRHDIRNSTRMPTYGPHTQLRTLHVSRRQTITHYTAVPEL
jgi:hypothetical protein